MRKIIKDLEQYFLQLHKGLFISAAVFTALLIFINYRFGLNDYLERLSPFVEYVGWFCVFFIAFSFFHIVQCCVAKNSVYKAPPFIFLLLLAPALFAWKMSANIQFFFTANTLLNNYWNKVIYWPVKLAVIVAVLAVVWRVFDKRQPFYGLSKKGISYQPYFFMLLLMIPLIALAAGQADFLYTYPKLKNVDFLSGEKNHWWYSLVYELSYGLDFVGIELFFRGFLVLAFAKWIGKDAILPMAIFYCTIHFGKPLGECISSFFGGLILGVVSYHTRSIYGGLIVHLGIAWLMELGGYLGNQGWI